jgi:hypothetical protein
MITGFVGVPHAGSIGSQAPASAPLVSWCPQPNIARTAKIDPMKRMVL